MFATAGGASGGLLLGSALLGLFFACCYVAMKRKRQGVPMVQASAVLDDIRSVREIERSLEEAEAFVSRVKANKVRLTLTDGAISISREEMAKITDLIITLERSGKALESAVHHLRDLMAYDELTQMFSRRYIFNLVEKEFLRSKRYGSRFSVIAFELDTSLGGARHIGLDDMNVLVSEAAGAIRHFVRDSDSPGRTGERTFLILLPETEEAGATVLAERIRMAVTKEYALSFGKQAVALYAAVVDCAALGVEDMASLLFAVDARLSDSRDGGSGADTVSVSPKTKSVKVAAGAAPKAGAAVKKASVAGKPAVKKPSAKPVVKAAAKGASVSKKG